MSPVPQTSLNIRAGSETAVARVGNHLRDQILTGALPPGERLTELDLARSLSVSRLTVRLALEELQRLGLTERRPSGGIQVTTPDARSLAEISTVALHLWKPLLLEIDFPSSREVVDEVITALHRMLAIIKNGQPQDGAEFASAFFAVFTPFIAKTNNRTWLAVHQALETRAAIAVRGFTESIDIPGLQTWAHSLKGALESGDQHAAQEAFTTLAQLSTAFTLQTTKLPN